MSKTNYVVANGDLVKESISGFTGVVIGTADYLTGCRQFLVNPNKLDKEGKLFESHWFDEGRLVVVKKSAVKAHQRGAEVAPGGPQPNAPVGRR